MSKTILIVDDHPIVLYGLRFLFEDDQTFSICGEASDIERARERALCLKPDFIILDLMLGGRDGLDLLRMLGDVSPQSRILVYSSQSERFFGRKCAAAGARGYVSKSEGLPVVAKALARLAAGGCYFAGTAYTEAGQKLETDDGLPPLDLLSTRELQVLRMIGDGWSTGQISAALALSVKTVGTYRERIKTKLDLVNVRDLDALARDYAAGRLQ